MSDSIRGGIFNLVKCVDADKQSESEPTSQSVRFKDWTKAQTQALKVCVASTPTLLFHLSFPGRHNTLSPFAAARDGSTAIYRHITVS
ncbi:hypothetical protein QVD17_03970 [Tagetes erecta]|uniref:Uncharacterized protein n=1 Tax=Tagetes erecta TaxID=13708 RepID=A0AAD8PAD7_TARER|nr:hypothetical protein QVD17_03970 [Tagetes erecta]